MVGRARRETTSWNSVHSLHLVLSLPFPEILDYGYPQKTDSGILKTYITQQGVRSQVSERSLLAGPNASSQ